MLRPGGKGPERARTSFALPSDNHPMIFKSFSAKLLKLQLSALAV